VFSTLKRLYQIESYDEEKESKTADSIPLETSGVGYSSNSEYVVVEQQNADYPCLEMLLEMESKD